MFNVRNGYLYALDAATGREKGRLDTAAPVRGSPIQVDFDGDGRGELVIPSGQRLLIYRTRASDLDWPMFKGDPTLSGATHALPQPRTPHPRLQPLGLSARGRLLFDWTVRDLGYFLRTRVDKHVASRLGRRRMSYWY